MIIFLVIIIIILIIIGCVWWFFIRNKNNNKSTALLNSYLRQYQPKSNFVEHNESSYPGNIDNAIEEINNNIMQHPNEQSVNLTNGHPELMEWENNFIQANSDSMASNLTNISGPIPPSMNPINTVNGPVIPYKESNDNSIDYDEKNSYQLLKRNDPIRPIVGEIHRKSFVDPYIREELETTAKKEWWGNGEY